MAGTAPVTALTPSLRLGTFSATPDTEFTADGLRQCRLTVPFSTKPNRSHLIHGRQALILPCLDPSEQNHQRSGNQFVSVENSMGVVSQSISDLISCSRHLLSEVAVVCGVGQATLGSRSGVTMEYMVANYEHIRARIKQVIPGFSDLNRRVRQKTDFTYPTIPTKATSDRPISAGPTLRQIRPRTTGRLRDAT